MSARTTRTHHAKPTGKAPLRASRGAAAAASAVIVVALTAGAMTPALAAPVDELVIDVASFPSAILTRDSTPTLSLPGRTGRDVWVDGVQVTPMWADGVDTLTLDLSDGAHNIQIVGNDVEGSLMAMLDVTVDTTAPTLDVLGLPDGARTNDTTPSYVVLSQIGAGVTYRVDGGAPVTVDGSDLTVGELAAGDHTVVVRSVDEAGNETEVTRTLTVDLEGPSVEQVSGPDGSDDVLYGQSPTFGFASEAGATWSYSFDGVPVGGDDAQVTVHDLEVGSHELVVVATDEAGNPSDPFVVDFEVVYEPVPEPEPTPEPTQEPTPVPTPVPSEAPVPSVAWVARPDASTTSTSARFAFAASEGSTVEYVLDLPEGAQYADVVSVDGLEFTLTDLALGHHKIMVSAVRDGARSERLDYEWDVVSAAPAPPATPVLSIDAIPADVIRHGISVGATGPYVAIIQNVVGVTPDGIFGRQTAAAVRAFQRAHGLVADGVVGRLTWAALVDAANGRTAVAPVSAASIPQSVINRGISSGARGEPVRIVQRIVGANSDGIFGPRTRAAVQAYQRAHGLVADGVVGRLTWAVMAPR
ncbi:peptidoglycan-binding protein [Cellulomonas sp. URHB0016]